MYAPWMGASKVVPSHLRLYRLLLASNILADIFLSVSHTVTYIYIENDEEKALVAAARQRFITTRKENGKSTRELPVDTSAPCLVRFRPCRDK